MTTKLWQLYWFIVRFPKEFRRKGYLLGNVFYWKNGKLKRQYPQLPRQK